MDELDQKVIETVSTRLCTTDRLTTMLNGLMQHFSKATASANANLAVAEKTLGVLDEKLRRLHRSIEDGLVPLDEVLRDRITELSGERERAKKLVDRLRKQLTPAQEINHQQIESFSSTFRERLKEGNPVLRRNYLKSVIGAVIVDEEQIRIVGHKLTIAESIGAFSFAPRKVHTFESNWRSIWSFSASVKLSGSSHMVQSGSGNSMIGFGFMPRLRRGTAFAGSAAETFGLAPCAE
jgi:hypothetical protein